MLKSSKELILVAEFAIILAIFSQFVLPFGLIPLTGQTFAVGLIATLLGKRLSTYCVFLYLLLGLLGLPVFAGLSSGIGVLFGPTGGYLIGFFANTLITGFILEKTSFSYPMAFFANVLGALATLLIGSGWLFFAADTGVLGALTGGFLPFLLPGIIKAFAAGYAGILIRRRLPKKFLTSLPQGR